MKVLVHTKDDLVWPIATFGSRDPIVVIGAGQYKRHLAVDPRPAYQIDTMLVEGLLNAVVERFPTKSAAAALLETIPFDFADHFNGITAHETMWKRPDGSEWKETYKHRTTGEPFEVRHGQVHNIVLAGKCIPHHPAMVRYLVPHEYGHVAFNHAQFHLGWQENEHQEYVASYAEMRGMRSETYSSGKWHSHPSEVAANDFRYLVMGAEKEFWPHDVPTPDTVPAVRAWWEKAFIACGNEPRFA